VNSYKFFLADVMVTFIQEIFLMMPRKHLRGSEFVLVMYFLL